MSALLTKLTVPDEVRSDSPPCGEALQSEPGISGVLKRLGGLVTSQQEIDNNPGARVTDRPTGKGR
jgi:hypothetical protein